MIRRSKIGQRDRRQGGDEGEAEDELGGFVAEDDGHQGEQKPRADLDQRIAGGDPLAAVATATPQQQPGDDRDVVVGDDLGAAARTARARGDDRLAARHPVGDHAEEAAGHGAAEEAE